ncbi:MAG: M20 family metallopeptidase [Candidatus Aenigmatarchaeota archaeon]
MTAIELAQELIRLNTGNPPGNESRVADVLEKRLKAAGFNVERVELAAGRANLIATWDGGPGKTLVILGHMDTIPAGQGWRHDPFGAVIENGKLFGRGAADMKGNLAAIVVALEQLKRSGWKPKGKLIFVASANEEMGDTEDIGMGAMAARLREMAGKDGILVFGDTTDFTITVAEKGVLWLEIVSHGKEAHGSTPWKGINAIEKLGKFLIALNNMEFTTNHPLLGKSTISINTISGGYKTNAVPELAKASVDIRLVPGDAKDKVMARIRALADEMKKKDNDMNIELKELIYLEPVETPATQPIVSVLKQAIKEATGKNAEVRGEHGATGASLFKKRTGLLTVACGPGKPEQAHTKDEWIDIKDIEAGVRLFEALAKKYLA